MEVQSSETKFSIANRQEVDAPEILLEAEQPPQWDRQEGTEEHPIHAGMPDNCDVPLGFLANSVETGYDPALQVPEAFPPGGSEGDRPAASPPEIPWVGPPHLGEGKPVPGAQVNFP